MNRYSFGANDRAYVRNVQPSNTLTTGYTSITIITTSMTTTKAWKNNSSFFFFVFHTIQLRTEQEGEREREWSGKFFSSISLHSSLFDLGTGGREAWHKMQFPFLRYVPSLKSVTLVLPLSPPTTTLFFSPSFPRSSPLANIGAKKGCTIIKKEYFGGGSVCRLLPVPMLLSRILESLAFFGKVLCAFFSYSTHTYSSSSSPSYNNWKRSYCTSHIANHYHFHHHNV